MTPARPLQLSGERLRVVYHLLGSADEARARAEELCIEQTVEFPPDLIDRQDIREQVFGRLESLDPIAEGRSEAVISFARETVGPELPQLLNVLFGNSSLKPGIRLVRLELPAGLLDSLRGPRFGRRGLRQLLGASERPLLCTALKPMGLSPVELAQLAEQFALGGIDLVKDDHGLADQPFCPFEERVQRCAEAVARANAQTGRACLYAPSLAGPVETLIGRARWSKSVGAGALLVAPGLVGFDAMRALADDDALALPILCHPALLGTFVTSPDSGIAHRVALGQLPRLAGADATIFPSYGGRFAFTCDDCRDLVDGTEQDQGSHRRIFPVPAGGLSVERVPEMLEFYGRDMILLIGGDLHRGADLVASCQRFRQVVDQAVQAAG